MENPVNAPHMDACSRAGKLKRENIEALRMKSFTCCLPGLYLDGQHCIKTHPGIVTTQNEQQTFSTAMGHKNPQRAHLLIFNCRYLPARCHTADGRDGFFCRSWWKGCRVVRLWSFNSIWQNLEKNNFTNNFQIPHLHCPKERVLQMLLAAPGLSKTHLGWCHWLRGR